MGSEDEVSASPSHDDELHDRVRRRLTDADQRYSTGRQRLVERLADIERPVTIPELLAERPEIPMSSAYRNLAVLEQVGVVTRIATFGEHARFELAEDLVGHHHHHLICTSCGRIEDFVVPDDIETNVNAAFAGVMEKTGFEPGSHRIDLIGTCADCRD